MRQHLFFDGIDLNDFGALPVIGNIYAAPARKYDTVSVPGRSGNLIIAQGGYENVSRSYDVVFSGDDVAGDAARLRTFLATRSGYKRIEDTLHPDEYYLGCFRGGLDSGIPENIKYVKYTLIFDSKPQRFLKSGEEARVFTASGVIVNPEIMPALPLIRVYGNGTVTVNGYAVTVSDNALNYTDVDCEIQDAYRGSSNRNGYITLGSGSFPELGPGENTVTLGAGITHVEITPRWWRL